MQPLAGKKKHERPRPRSFGSVPRFTLNAYAAYVPYTEDRDLQLSVDLLGKAGVPESADEVFRKPEGHMTGEEIRAAISGQTFVDTRPLRFAGTLNTFDPSGTMNGRPQAGSPAEQFGSDQGKWWIEGDKFCRKWTRWQAGRTGCFSFLLDGDSIQLDQSLRRVSFGNEKAGLILAGRGQVSDIEDVEGQRWLDRRSTFRPRRGRGCRAAYPRSKHDSRR